MHINICTYIYIYWLIVVQPAKTSELCALYFFYQKDVVDVNSKFFSLLLRWLKSSKTEIWGFCLRIHAAFAHHWHDFPCAIVWGNDVFISNIRLVESTNKQIKQTNITCIYIYRERDTMWGALAMSWFITPINYTYGDHKQGVIGVINQLRYLGGPTL